MAFEITRVTRIKNHSGHPALVKCSETGKGYELSAKQELSASVNIPWANNFLQVWVKDVGTAYMTQKGSQILAGPSLTLMSVVFPDSSLSGDRDLVIGENGLRLYPAGKSPTKLYSGPARSGGIGALSDGPDGDALDTVTFEEDFAAFGDDAPLA